MERRFDLLSDDDVLGVKEVLRSVGRYAAKRNRAARALKPQGHLDLYRHLVNGGCGTQELARFRKSTSGEVFYLFEEYTFKLPYWRPRPLSDSCYEKPNLEERKIHPQDPLLSRLFLRGLQSMAEWRALCAALPHRFRVEVHAFHSMDDHEELHRWHVRPFVWAIFVDGGS